MPKPMYYTLLLVSWIKIILLLHFGIETPLPKMGIYWPPANFWEWPSYFLDS